MDTPVAEPIPIGSAKSIYNRRQLKRFRGPVVRLRRRAVLLYVLVRCVYYTARHWASNGEFGERKTRFRYCAGDTILWNWNYGERWSIVSNGCERMRARNHEIVFVDISLLADLHVFLKCGPIVDQLWSNCALIIIEIEKRNRTGFINMDKYRLIAGKNVWWISEDVYLCLYTPCGERIEK